MKYSIEKKTLHQAAQEEKAEYKRMSSVERLDLVEVLRLEAGKFLYEYPARLRRVIKVTRKKQS